MAKQTGMILLEGPIGNMNCYKSKYGHIAREKSSVDGKRIARDPAFQRTRENASEFGNASAAGGLLRRTLQPLLYKKSDGTLPSRLTAAMTRIVKTDPVSARGKRKVLAGNLQMLKGFELNANARLGAVFSMPVKTSIHALTGMMDISISSFVPEGVISFPPGATHFAIISAGIALNFEKKEWRRDIQKTGMFSADRVTDPIHLVIHTDTVDQQALFLVMGIEFFQELNGNFYPLQNGSFNGLVVTGAVRLKDQEDKGQGTRIKVQERGLKVLPERSEESRLFLVMRNYQMIILFVVVMAVCYSVANAQVKNNLPQLIRTNGVTQLYADKKPLFNPGWRVG